ncbi:hypothetical protein DDY07_23795 [Methylomonas sp. ZR1]|nr:hypothetical protein [Methylomonas sp. ZR1]
MVVSVSLQVRNATERIASQEGRPVFRDSENAPRNQKKAVDEDDIYTDFRFFGGRVEAPTRKYVHMS